MAKALLLASVVSGLCAPAQANTTADDSAATPPVSGVTRLALMLPLRSGVFGAAADAVRTGFLTAYEREKEGIAITIIETGDTTQDMVDAYRTASDNYDVIVGPLSRSAVTAIAMSGKVLKPTIALAQPDLPAEAEPMLPKQMLMAGLSVEDEARQVALWVEREKTPGKIFAVSTNVAWQKRAVKAFVTQARSIGMKVESLELSTPGNVLSASGLAQLGQRVQAEQPALLFVALDASQAIQLRSAIGTDVALYGTSQLNPLTLTGRTADNRLPELDGVRLVDMPWQLQTDRPAVMIYPHALAAADAKPNADLERLYALGIDAYRVAHEIALQRSGFDIDGVTGKIHVNMVSGGATYFQRAEMQAVYQDGVPVPYADQH